MSDIEILIFGGIFIFLFVLAFILTFLEFRKMENNPLPYLEHPELMKKKDKK